MKNAYCAQSCASSSSLISHKCQPWFFLVGGSGNKRNAGSEEELEREAESRYMRLLAAYKRKPDPSILEQLEEAFGGMSLEKQKEFEAGEPCHETRDLITFDDISDLEEDNVMYIFENNLKYCYNLDAFLRYLKTRNISPVSRRPFTADELARVREAATIRLPSIWEHWRNTDDTNPAALDEWEQTLHHSYGVAEHTIQDARAVRAQHHLDELYSSRLTKDDIMRHWTILRGTYHIKMARLDWERLEPRLTPATLSLFFSDWADVAEFFKANPSARARTQGFYWEGRFSRTKRARWLFPAESRVLLN